MPIYAYYCARCDRDSEESVAIAQRDEPQDCECGNTKYRKLKFQGSVWSPTANGGHK